MFSLWTSLVVLSLAQKLLFYNLSLNFSGYQLFAYLNSFPYALV